MKDRKGNDVKVGDRVYVIPQGDIGGAGYVRRVKDDKARIDDGPADLPEDDDSWNWGAWCEANEFELI
jgi:hypothetical protein